MPAESPDNLPLPQPLSDESLSELKEARERGFIRYPEPSLGATPEQTDLVNHPPHYKQHPNGIECIDVVEFMSFNLGNAVKYIWRHEYKGQSIPEKLQDLEKARWYIDREIERFKATTAGIED